MGRYGGTGADALRYQLPHGASAGLVFTAPHAVAHWRDGVRKPADMFTGFLAEALAERADAASLTAEGEQRVDANFEDRGAFRELLWMVTTSSPAVVDIHGMADSHGVDVCLGTAGRHPLSKRLTECLEAALTQAGFRVSVDDPFDANKFPTITAGAHERGCEAVQVEVSKWLRRPIDDPEPVLVLIDSVAHALSTHTAHTSVR